MKLTELQSVLGEEINKVRQSDADEDVIRGAQTIRGRLKFGNAKNSAPFPSMIVVF